MRQRSDDKYGQLLIVPEIRFAHAALFRLSESSPPVVTIHGPAGTGKTHLARYLVSELIRQHPETKQSHITAGEFTIELAKASNAGTIPAFQELYSRMDLLVCEDLQSIEGRKHSQQQLIVILDAVLAQGGRVLLTCDRSPGQWSRISSRLKNRCVGGVCAATELPSASSREKFLLHFAEERGISLSPEILTYLAESLVASPRELRGAVIQLQYLAKQHGQRLDRDIAQSVVDEAMLAEMPTMARIAKVVAKWFEVPMRDLKSQARYRGLVIPRQVAMFAAREWTQHGYAEIGRYFGRRSHSTIVHACQKIRDRIASDSEFRRNVECIKEQLNVSKCARPNRSISS